MATSLGTNAVVLTKAHCITNFVVSNVGIKRVVRTCTSKEELQYWNHFGMVSRNNYCFVGGVLERRGDLNYFYSIETTL